MDVARGRMWTAGIYDEARRGWLLPPDGEKGPKGLAFSEQGRNVSKPGEWNKLRIVANGSSIRTWLNDVPRADIHDSLTPEGLIGLQVFMASARSKSKVRRKVRFTGQASASTSWLAKTICCHPGRRKADGCTALLLWDAPDDHVAGTARSRIRFRKRAG